MLKNLPVYEYLDKINRMLLESPALVLRAAPGAGKTMLVPPAAASCTGRRVLLIEPRRVAAKSAAAGMSYLLGTRLGDEFGFAVRGEVCRTPQTRVLAVTPGVFLNMLRNDPSLDGVGCVIFDEFHERSVECDLAFTLLLDVKAAFCPELKLILMSATMPGERLGEILDCPVMDIPGREFPVEIRYCDWETNDLFKLPDLTARAVLKTYVETTGDMLVFLPGAREINKVFDILCRAALPGAEVMKLHGSLSLSEQSRVLKKLPDGKRKIILSTNIAESSLTIDGVKVVIDSGWERKMRYDQVDAMPHLDYSRITLASAAQRSGRAGRTAPGVAVRLWKNLDERNFREYHLPEILDCDLAPVVLELAAWGAAVDDLQWLDAPGAGGISAAKELLTGLGLLDRNGGYLTGAGKFAADMPVHPRLGAMLKYAVDNGCAGLGCELAALLGERDIVRNSENSDIRERVLMFRRDPGRAGAVKNAFDKLASLCRLQDGGGDNDVANCGLILAHGFPDRIGRARQRHSVNYQLSGTRAAVLQNNDPLRSSEFLVAAELESGFGENAFIRLAAPLTLEEIECEFAHLIVEETECFYDSNADKGGARMVRKIGNLILSEKSVAPDADVLAQAVLDEALRRGVALPPVECKAAVALVERIGFAARNEDDFQAFDAEALRMAVMPYADKVRSIGALQKLPWLEIVKNFLSYNEMRELDRLYPETYRTPAGCCAVIDYSGEVPAARVPLPQLYGEKVHPVIGRKRLPLKLELLSPGNRPVQITGDLPGFWQGSWKLVRTEMRSRYPKHEWPEDPANASPMRNSVKKYKNQEKQ